MTWEPRYHPLRNEWVVVAGHRQHRPWQGELQARARRAEPSLRNRHGGAAARRFARSLQGALKALKRAERDLAELKRSARALAAREPRLADSFDSVEALAHAAGRLDVVGGGGVRASRQYMVRAATCHPI